MSLVPRPAYTIRTRRLRLRPWEPTDAPALSAALAESREHLSPWLAWARDEPLPTAQRVDRIRRFRAQFDLGSDFTYGVFDAATGAVLGGAGLHHRVGPAAAEIGYWIHVAHTGQGLATEVAAALSLVGLRSLPYQKLEIRVVPDNEASARIPRRLGFRLDGLSRAAVPGVERSDPWRPLEVHSLLRIELAASGCPAQAAGCTALDAIGAPLPLEAP